jgi:hypothetical protein
MKEELLAKLKTKEHNWHYLNRYIKFIVFCQETNSDIKNEDIEKHHILPKAKDMFPEYHDFTKYPENCVVLTYRQHIIAHYILMKAYNTKSQILSFLRTTQQIHAKKLNIKNINTKKIEKAKIELSKKMKGCFTRGYDTCGKAKVSKETKNILSQIKKDFYSNPDNRNKQSIACKGKKRKNTENHIKAAKQRVRFAGDKRSQTLKETIKQKKLLGTWKTPIKKGIFMTPFGAFSNLKNAYRDWCLNPDKVLTMHNAKKSTLCNISVVGKTPRQLGFYFITKDDPLFLQLYECLNQVHQPEPTHALSSELNDFLLREKLLPQN